MSLLRHICRFNDIIFFFYVARIGFRSDHLFWTELNVDVKLQFNYYTRKQTNSNTIRKILSPPADLFKGIVPLDLPSFKLAIIYIKVLRTVP